MPPFFPFRFHPHSQNWTTPTLQQLAEEKMTVAHTATEMAACTRRNRWPLPLPFSVVPSCSTKPPNVPASACLWISESLLNHQQYVSCERPQNASRPYQQQQICNNTHPYTRSNAFFLLCPKPLCEISLWPYGCRTEAEVNDPPVYILCRTESFRSMPPAQLSAFVCVLFGSLVLCSDVLLPFYCKCFRSVFFVAHYIYTHYKQALPSKKSADTITRLELVFTGKFLLLKVYFYLFCLFVEIDSKNVFQTVDPF